MGKILDSLQSLDKKKLFLTNFPYLICGYFTDKIASLYRVSDGTTGWDKLMETLNYFERAFADPFPDKYGFKGAFSGMMHRFSTRNEHWGYVAIFLNTTKCPYQRAISGFG